LHPAEEIEIHYNEKRVIRLGLFQDWAMQRVAGTGAVIECCPSSNKAIVGFRHTHPVVRFLAANLPVVIGADDPGIFDTDLAREFKLLRSWGIGEASIQAMQMRSMDLAGEL